MKAIETRYGGCHFRSRIEARWAVFFDVLGIPLEYEPQGFELPADDYFTEPAYYLPDFFLPNWGPGRQGMWWEVKGAPPTKDEQNLAFRLSMDSGQPVRIAHGAIGRGAHDTNIQCVGSAPEFFGVGAAGGLFLRPVLEAGDELAPEASHPELLDAYTAARSARFEHGWSGAS
jgi:hypothetical protein